MQLTDGTKENKDGEAEQRETNLQVISLLLLGKTFLPTLNNYNGCLQSFWLPKLIAFIKMETEGFILQVTG